MFGDRPRHRPPDRVESSMASVVPPACQALIRQLAAPDSQHPTRSALHLPMAPTAVAVPRPSSAPRRPATPSVRFQEDVRAFALRHRQPAKLDELPPPASPIRHRARSTGSLVESAESARRLPHRIRICYQDDNYRLRSEARARSLMAAATAPPSPNGDSLGGGNSALLAKKALKYRKVFDRMTGVDVHDPAFDVSKFLGVAWCKTPGGLLKQPQE